MIDPFVLLTPVLVLGVMALLRFIGCDHFLGLDYVVQAVSFVPQGGSYFGATDVTLSSEPLANILYTTMDTGDPNLSFVSKIHVASNTTIRATATKEGGSSGVQSARYLIGPITFLDVKENDDTTNNNTVDTPAFGVLQQGVLMVVWIWYIDPTNGNIEVQNVSDSGGNTYFRAAGPTPAQGTVSGHRQELWYSTIQTTGTGFVVTATFPSAPPFPSRKSISAHAYVGADPDNPLDATNPPTEAASLTGNSINVSTGSVTTDHARLIFGAVVIVGASGMPGGTFRARTMLPNGNVSEDADVMMPGQMVAATFQINLGPASWIAQMCAFK